MIRFRKLRLTGDLVHIENIINSTYFMKLYLLESDS